MNPAYAVAVMGAALYGTADFLGGLAARRASAMAVTLASAVAGLVTLALAMLFASGAPSTADLAFGAAAGVCGGLGVSLLFRALAIGPVSVAAPVISVVSLSVPVIVGLALGERPTGLALAGIGLAIGAFPLLARRDASESASARAAMIPIALTSGVLVGGFLVCVGRISAGAGLLPLIMARAVTITMFAAILGARREPLWPSPSARLALVSGMLDSLANLAYFAAVHRGPLTIVSTIVSLAPAATVLLARIVLRERWSLAQRAGLVCAAAAIVCVSLG